MSKTHGRPKVCDALSEGGAQRREHTGTKRTAARRFANTLPEGGAQRRERTGTKRTAARRCAMPFRMAVRSAGSPYEFHP